MKEYGKWNRWKSTVLTMAVLATGICGCSRNVDYQVETETTGKETSGGIVQFQNEDTWKDDWTVQTSDGKVNLNIYADIELPEGNSMAVVQAKRALLDAEYKKQFLDAYFSGTTVYYHDTEHLTKDELQRLIRQNQNDVNGMQEKLDEGVGLSETDKARQQGYVNEYKEQITEYENALKNAKDERTKAEDYGSCNSYAGYIGDLLCQVTFYPDEKDGQYLERVSAGPDTSGCVDQYYGPESMSGDDIVNGNFYTDSGDLLSDGNQDAGQKNESSITQEEAQKTAERFLNKIGRTNQVCTASDAYVWTGGMKDSSGVITQQNTTADGYIFSYGTGVNGEAFCEDFDYTRYDSLWQDQDALENGYSEADRAQIAVNDAGTIQIELTAPVTIEKITDQVELLSLDNIKEIIKDEVMTNPDAYTLVEHKYFNGLKLGYAKIKNDSDAGSCSYVPAWCFYAKGGNEVDYHPVFVNAIDGTVFYAKDEA